MQKIPSLFQRDHAKSKRVYDSVVPGSEWVTAGEGIATRKWDGIATMVKDGHVYKRYDARAGRTPPADFAPLMPAPDPHTGHWPGWLPAKLPDDKWLLEGVAWGKEHLFMGGDIPDGTYEVVGPHIGTRHGANPESLAQEELRQHGDTVLHDCPRDYEGLRNYLWERTMEGVVWHHPDGRMVKIKRNDFPKPGVVLDLSHMA